MARLPFRARTQPGRLRNRAHQRLWTALAVAILLGGLTLSAVGGTLWRNDQRRQERQSVRAAAANVTATLGTLLRRDADFVATLRAVLSMNPGLGASGFAQWYANLEGGERQVGGIGSAVVASVPAAQVATFAARRNRDPAFRALMGRWLTSVRPTAASRECLLAAGGEIVPLDALTGPMVQQDWCSPRTVVGAYERPALLGEADSGQLMVVPVAVSWLNTVFFETAFYRAGAPIDTVAQRRAALLGWVLSSFDIKAILRDALAHNRGLELSLYHQDTSGGTPVLLGSAGAGAAHPDVTVRTPMSIDGRWLIVARGSALTAATPPDEQGILVFAAGALVTVLLVVLVLVLVRSREHALAMVSEKTTQLRHQALHDALTGLPNRVLALDRAEQMLARARRTDTSVAALYLDIDGFKQINDTFGHQAGDRFLQLVAGRLLGVIRESDTAARLAGDEFVVLLEGGAVDAAPEFVAERLMEVLREPYDLGLEIDRPVTASASIGVAQGQRAAAEDLLADADLALYAAKTQGKDRYVVFESSMQTAAQDRLALGLDLAGALAAGEMFLVYQPTFDLSSERVIGAEALLRWRHPTRGLVPPDTFIPAAEESGRIVPIGRWVLDQACRQAAEWHARGHTLGISVNVSGRQLEREDFVQSVVRALEEADLDPATLTIEITETALMRDTDAVAQRLRGLKEVGVRIAIDDFGTGYSSLAYLQTFPIDALKIDRSFISGLAGSKDGSALVRTLVQLGKTLGLETLAEGIEEPVQLQHLRRERCDHGQGFLLARPLELAAINEFLEAQLRQPA